MAKERDYRKEYQARVRRAKGLPRLVARGHGPLSAARARALEKGSAKDASSTDRREARRIRRTSARNVAAYESRYGPAGGGHVGRERTLGRSFASREDAHGFIARNYPSVDPDSEYVEYRQLASGRWKVTLKR